MYASRQGVQPAPGRPKLRKDEREVMQASLLLGSVVHMDRDGVDGMKERLGGSKNGSSEKAMEAPPFLNSSPPLYADGHGTRFDTVSGWTQTVRRTASGYEPNPACPRSKVYIVYENGRAYPEYLVRYYRGERDPGRTPYATQQDVPSAGIDVQAELEPECE